MNQLPFHEKFAQWFEPSRIESLAREVGWLIRQGKIDSFEFFSGLVLAQMSALEITLKAQSSCYAEPVSRQAVDQRFNERAIKLFEAAFKECLQKSLDESPSASLAMDLGRRFSAVRLVDSTSFDVIESLAEIYPGCGGGASSANCKVLLSYEYLRGQFQPLSLLPGKRTDSGLAMELPSLVKANELLLFDKGFFKLQALLAIHQKQGFFLTPYHRSANLWKDQGLVPLDLVQALGQSSENVVEWPQVLLGSEGLQVPVRVVAYRLSEQSANRHRAALRRSYVKKGATPPAAALELAGWLILMTNAPAQLLPTSAMAYLYRLRWQIELIFKQCKSVLRLHKTEARNNQYRVQCEIWARLTGAVILFAWHGHLQEACSARSQKEISFAQVASTFQQWGFTLARMFIAQGQTLRNGLRRLWRHLLRTAVKGRQRSRKTSWEALAHNWFQVAKT